MTVTRSIDACFILCIEGCEIAYATAVPGFSTVPSSMHADAGGLELPGDGAKIVAAMTAPPAFTEQAREPLGQGQINSSVSVRVADLASAAATESLQTGDRIISHLFRPQALPFLRLVTTLSAGATSFALGPTGLTGTLIFIERECIKLGVESPTGTYALSRGQFGTDAVAHNYGVNNELRTPIPVYRYLPNFETRRCAIIAGQQSASNTQYWRVLFHGLVRSVQPAPGCAEWQFQCEDLIAVLGRTWTPRTFPVALVRRATAGEVAISGKSDDLNITIELEGTPADFSALSSGDWVDVGGEVMALSGKTSPNLLHVKGRERALLGTNLFSKDFPTTYSQTDDTESLTAFQLQRVAFDSEFPIAYDGGGIVRKLLHSRDGDGSLSANYDVYKSGIGCGLRAGFVDSTEFARAGSRLFWSPVSELILGRGGKSIQIRELISLVCGAYSTGFVVNWAGKIQPVIDAAPSPLEHDDYTSAPITDTLPDPDNQSGEHAQPALIYPPDRHVSSISIEYDYDPVNERFGKRDVLHLESPTAGAFSRRPRTIELKIPAAYRDVVITKIHRTPMVRGIIGKVQALANQLAPFMTVRIGYYYATDIDVGDLVKIPNSFFNLHNPNSGGVGLASFTSSVPTVWRVISKRVLGGHGGAAEFDFMLYFGRPYRVIGPSAYIDSWTGSPVFSATVLENHFITTANKYLENTTPSWASGGITRDTDLFTAGMKVGVWRPNDNSPHGAGWVFFAEVLSVSATSIDLRNITGTRAGDAPQQDDIIRFRNYSECASASSTPTQIDVFAFAAYKGSTAQLVDGGEYLPDDTSASPTYTTEPHIFSY